MKMRSWVACAEKKKPQTRGGRKAAFGRAAYCTPVRNGCKVFLFVIFYFIFLIGLWRQQNGLSGAVSPLSSGAVRGFCGAGGCDQNAAQPDHERAHRACVSVLRHARHGQNLDGEGVRARGQLRTPENGAIPAAHATPVGRWRRKTASIFWKSTRPATTAWTRSAICAKR